MYECNEPTDHVQTAKNTFKTQQVIQLRALWRAAVFPPRFKMTPAHTQAHAACRGFGSCLCVPLSSVCPQPTDVICLPLMCLNGCVHVTAIIFRVHARRTSWGCFCGSVPGAHTVPRGVGGGGDTAVPGRPCLHLQTFSAALCTFGSVTPCLEPVLHRSRVLLSHPRHVEQSSAVCSDRDNNSEPSRFLQTQLVL